MILQEKQNLQLQLFQLLSGKNKIYRYKNFLLFWLSDLFGKAMYTLRIIQNYFRISRTLKNRPTSHLYIYKYYIYVRLFLFLFTYYFLLLKDRTFFRTHVELYIFQILTITDKENVLGQSKTLREVDIHSLS